MLFGRSSLPTNRWRNCQCCAASTMISVRQMTATSNRIRGLLTQIHPALERIVGPHLDHPAMLDLLQHYPSPAAMKTARITRMATPLLRLAPRMGRRLAEEISQALSERTVIVVGTNAAATVLPRLAE